MVDIQLTQEELILIIGLIDHSINKGGLRLGDIYNILPILGKLNEKLEKSPVEGVVVPKDEKKVEPIKN